MEVRSRAAPHAVHAGRPNCSSSFSGRRKHSSRPIDVFTHNYLKVFLWLYFFLFFSSLFGVKKGKFILFIFNCSFNFLVVVCVVGRATARQHRHPYLVSYTKKLTKPSKHQNRDNFSKIDCRIRVIHRRIMLAFSHAICNQSHQNTQRTHGTRCMAMAVSLQRWSRSNPLQLVCDFMSAEDVYSMQR